MKMLIRNHSGFILVLTLMFFVRGTFADQNVVPSGSMEPTIQVGDHILVNKLAYDIHLPFSKFIVGHVADPLRGEVIVFHHPQTDMRMVKRLVGLPGDRVRIHNEKLFINGEPIASSPSRNQGSGAELVRELIGTRAVVVKHLPELARSEDLEVIIPADHFFAMGDNRDNSWDSRYWGFVPRDHLEGRAVAVLYNWQWWPSLKADLSRVVVTL